MFRNFYGRINDTESSQTQTNSDQTIELPDTSVDAH